MATFIAAFVILLLAAAGLGLGWLLRGRELKGTCATLGTMRDEPCPVCGSRPENCDKTPAKP
jgi:hypothetical protein